MHTAGHHVPRALPVNSGGGPTMCIACLCMLLRAPLRSCLRSRLDSPMGSVDLRRLRSSWSREQNSASAPKSMLVINAYIWVRRTLWDVISAGGRSMCAAGAYLKMLCSSDAPLSRTALLASASMVGTSRRLLQACMRSLRPRWISCLPSTSRYPSWIESHSGTTCVGSSPSFSASRQRT